MYCDVPPCAPTTTPVSGMETSNDSVPDSYYRYRPAGIPRDSPACKGESGYDPQPRRCDGRSAGTSALLLAVRDIYAQGTMSPVDIQVLSLTNAFENGCEWCMAFHSAGALKEGLSKEDLASLRAGNAPTDARLEALSDFARTMVRNRGRVTEQDIGAFYAAGFTRSQALEVVLGAGFSVIANFAGHLVHAPLGLPFEQFAWSRAQGTAGDRVTPKTAAHVQALTG